MTAAADAEKKPLKTTDPLGAEAQGWYHGTGNTTRGRLPEAALTARAIFFEERGNSVPAVHTLGPSAGVRPMRTAIDRSVA